MIHITCFQNLPLKRARRGEVLSIALSFPKNVGVKHRVACLCPTWDMILKLKRHEISEQEYTDRYRSLLASRWSAVKRWLEALPDDQDLYLCCWEKTGFCHRYLVAKLIRKFRPDIELRVT